jgi:hypothetical protein
LFVQPEDFAPLAGRFILSERVEIYIPTTIHNIPASRRVVNVARRLAASSFAKWFGGYTETRGVGGWVSPDKGLIRETVFIVAAGCTTAALAEHLPAVVALAEKIADAMEQEAVTVSVNGRMVFVNVPVAVS